MLEVGDGPFARLGLEKITQHSGVNTFVVDLFVVRRAREQELLVFLEKGGAVGSAIVPNQNNPTAGVENAFEFFTAAGPVEPMKGLAGGNEIHTLSRQGGRLGRGCNAR